LPLSAQEVCTSERAWHQADADAPESKRRGWAEHGQESPAAAPTLARVRRMQSLASSAHHPSSHPAVQRLPLSIGCAPRRRLLPASRRPHRSWRRTSPLAPRQAARWPEP